MAVNLKLVRLGVCRISIGIRESIVALVGVDRLKLHRVLGGEGVEVGLDDLAFASLIAEGQGCADEFPSCLLHGLVETVLVLGLAMSVGAISMLASHNGGENAGNIRAGNSGAGNRQAGDDAGETHSD